MTDPRTKNVLLTYLDLPTGDRSPTIDRLIDQSDFSKAPEPAATTIARHIRLRLILGDLYEELGAYFVPDNQDSAEYLRAGQKHTQEKLHRTLALLTENGRNAHRIMGRQDQPRGTFFTRVRDPGPQRSTTTPPLYLIEMEND